MKLYFKTMTNKISIDVQRRTYKLNDNCESYGAYVVVSQWEFEKILKQLKVNRFSETK